MDKKMAKWFANHPDDFNWNDTDITDEDLFYLGIECLAKALHYRNDNGGHSYEDIVFLVRLVIPKVDDNNMDNTIINFLHDNLDKVRDYKNGNDKILGFFIGKLIKIIGPSCDGKLLKEKILENIGDIVT